MKKKKKVAPEQSSEWKPIVSSLLAGQAEDIQKKRGKGRMGTAAAVMPALGEAIRNDPRQMMRSQVLG